MRQTRRAVDTASQPWEVLSDVLQRKVLNGDPDGGPHTLLLRSGPREPGPDFAQYHPIDEELFGLDGDFTFDGRTWFKAGSYAFYPAYFVHGSDVHVRGGYCVYLRQSGPSELLMVDKAESHIPYFVGDGESGDYAMQMADAALEAQSVDVIDDGSVTSAALHRDASTGKGSTIITTAQGSTGQILQIASKGLLEVFTESGQFSLGKPLAKDDGYQFDPGNCLKRHAYHCEVDEHPELTLRCDTPGKLFISHDGELTIECQGTAPTTQGHTP